MGLGCLFCKKPTRLFNVHVIYGCTECTVRDKIVDLFGPVDEYLSKDDGVCLVCVLFLNTLMCIKNFMFTTIVASKANNNIAKDVAPNFASHYTDFLTSLQKLRPAYCGTNVENNSEIPSDMLIPLLAPAYSLPHKQRTEADIKRFNDFAQKYRNHCIGSFDNEVEQTLSKPARKRPRRPRKPLRSGSRLSTQSEPVLKSKRSRSSTSEISDCSYLGDSDNDQLRYDKGRLLNKRTRSVSRILDSIANKISDVTYKCVDGCTNEFDDLTLLTKHKMEDHKMLAKYWCYECHMTKFTSQEDLNRHNHLYHNVLISNCFLCSEELQTRQELQRHLEEHRIHSVPCNYCDKFFLNGRTCHKHIKECHKGKRKRIKKARPQTILDRIDKVDDYYENDSMDEFHEPYSDFTIKILIQSNADNNNRDDDSCVGFNDSANNSPTFCTDKANETFDKSPESETNAIVDDQSKLEAKISEDCAIEADNESSLIDGTESMETVNEITDHASEINTNENNDYFEESYDDSFVEKTVDANVVNEIMDESDVNGYDESVETPEVIQEVLIENDEYDVQPEAEGTSAEKLVIENEHFIDQTDIFQEVVIEEVVESTNKTPRGEDSQSTIKNLKIVIKELKLGKEKTLDKRKHKSKQKSKSEYDKHAAKKKSKLKVKITDEDNKAARYFKSHLDQTVEGVSKKAPLDEKKLQVYEFSEECDDAKYTGKLHTKVGETASHGKKKIGAKKLEKAADMREVSVKTSKKTKSTDVGSSSGKKVYGNKKLRKSRRKSVERDHKNVNKKNV